MSQYQHPNAASGQQHGMTTPVKYFDPEGSDDEAPSAQASRGAERAARPVLRTPGNKRGSDSGGTPGNHPSSSYYQTASRSQFDSPYGLEHTGHQMLSKMFPRDIRTEMGDPFVTTEDRTTMDKKLSPEAPLFIPPMPKPITFGVPTRTTGRDGTVKVDNTSPRRAVTNGGLQGSPMNAQLPSVVERDQFSTETQVTRTIKVTSLFAQVNGAEVEKSLSEQKSPRAKLLGSRQKIRQGESMIVRYCDIRDAEKGYLYLKAKHPEWQVEFVHPDSIRNVRADDKVMSRHEGQVIVSATGTFSNRQSMESQFVQLLKSRGDLKTYQVQLGTGANEFKIVAEFYNIEAAKFAVESLNGTNVNGVTIQVSMNTPDLAVLPITPPNAKGGSDDNGMVDGMARMGFVNNPQIHGSGYAILTPTTRPFLQSGIGATPGAALETPYQQNQYPPTTPYGGGNGSQVAFFTPPTYLTPGQYSNGYTPTYSGGIGPLAARMSYTCPPPTASYRSPWNGTSTPLTGPRAQGIFGDRSLAPYHPHMTPSHVGFRRRPVNMRTGDSNPSHNVVDLEKISEGLDVRTTIMLRNIPNKIDQVMLKSIVDETSFGKYDFMYLRIDFANNCNVGYAFLNFEDPLDIIDFVNARAGQRWNRFNSDKVAEVSYATIQGKDCLVQKFRNSSVMLEEPAFRPKIFYTQGHPLAGQEEEFAKPDNPSKMRRSVENAEHVGLYAPRAGQHYRDEQRRRRSQYDRGTRLAELEENGFPHSQSMPVFMPMGNNGMQFGMPSYELPQYAIPQYGMTPMAPYALGDVGGNQYASPQQWMANSPVDGPLIGSPWAAYPGYGGN